MFERKKWVGITINGCTSCPYKYSGTSQRDPLFKSRAIFYLTKYSSNVFRFLECSQRPHTAWLGSLQVHATFLRSQKQDQLFLHTKHITQNSNKLSTTKCKILWWQVVMRGVREKIRNGDGYVPFAAGHVPRSELHCHSLIHFPRQQKVQPFQWQR